jgi:nucleotide-binding universal stress UspA family protein
MQSMLSGQERPPVVVAIDGSRNYLATVDAGVAEAVRRDIPLRVLHVWPGYYTGSFRSRNPMPVEADGQHLLEVAARRVRHHAPELDVGTELVRGSVSKLLVQRSATARLLVIGHRDEMLTRPSWGSTAAYLAHHSACPLLVNRGPNSDRGPVVLAASARDDATATVACAYQEAALSGSKLVAVHVWAQPGRPDRSAPAGAASAVVRGRQQADRRLTDALAGWSWSFPEVSIERVVLHDLDVAYTLERASRRGRLLVAGIGRDGRFAELLYGSPGLSLARQAACPVLLVPQAWRFFGTESPSPGAVTTTDPS